MDAALHMKVVAAEGAVRCKLEVLAIVSKKSWASLASARFHSTGKTIDKRAASVWEAQGAAASRVKLETVASRRAAVWVGRRGKRQTLPWSREEPAKLLRRRLTRLPE